jgi:hypothetical protein
MKWEKNRWGRNNNRKSGTERIKLVWARNANGRKHGQKEYIIGSHQEITREDTQGNRNKRILQMITSSGLEPEDVEDWWKWCVG